MIIMKTVKKEGGIINNELVKNLLQKHFGNPRTSLTIGEISDPSDRFYFYSAREIDQITSIKKLLEKGRRDCIIDNLPELKQTILTNDNGKTEAPQCVCFREMDGNWIAYFHRIIGVTYHQDYGQSVEATLQIDINPYVILSNRNNDFYGFWGKTRSKKHLPYNERDGFSCWMNKALKINEQFRNFAVDFFFAIGETEHLYILKDVARAISNCGCFLPPVSYQKLLEFRKPSELTRSLQEEKVELNIDFNKVDINVGYIMVMLAPKVEKADWKHISMIDSQIARDAISLKLFYDGFSAEEFVRWYYRKRFKGIGFESEIKMYAEDYVEMCLETEEKFKLSCDFNALIKTHNELIAKTMLKSTKEELCKPLVCVPLKFDDLEHAIKKTGSTEFERICTTERLFQEGKQQHNCVFSRRNLVRKDRASIYRWTHNGVNYTVQFIRNRKGFYCVDEVRSKFNHSITKEDFMELKNIVSEFCSVDIELMNEIQHQEPVVIQYPCSNNDDEIEDQQSDLPF